ncbi:glutaminyl-peptide cyclotransferase isoform X2 [Meles meles]|uniref:glutaminyl-peptide cyclotransferase isoform X2 n=1 Tax=Meles meles TaxID=9662 RepID=UPI001E69D75D|nr:glutaminyl-peptide cyclotransferase isoform X2 [Meles meles]
MMGCYKGNTLRFSSSGFVQGESQFPHLSRGVNSYLPWLQRLQKGHRKSQATRTVPGIEVFSKCRFPVYPSLKRCGKTLHNHTGHLMDPLSSFYSHDTAGPGDHKNASSLSVPPVLLLQGKEVAGFVPSVQNLLPPRTAQPPGLRRSGVGGGELRPRPAQRSGEGTRRRWGGGRSRPKGGEGGRRRTRVPGLVTAGGQGSLRPDSLGDGRRRGPAGHGHPPPAAVGGRSAPGGPGGQIPRLGGLDPGEDATTYAHLLVETISHRDPGEDVGRQLKSYCIRRKTFHGCSVGVR